MKQIACQGKMQVKSIYCWFADIFN